MRLAPFILTLLLAVSSYSGEAFRNYASCISVQDIEIIGDTIWVASSGGVYKHSRSTGKGSLLPNTSLLPDPLHTALYYDSDKSLWSGTALGYLAKRTIKGQVSVSHSYVSASWPITDLLSYGKHLIVGSSKGVSFFDKKMLTAVKSSVKFKTFSTSIVNALIVHGKTLYVGLDKGVAILDLSRNLDSINLFDPGVWKMDTVAKPVRSFLVMAGSVNTFAGLSANFKGKVLRSDSNVLYYDNKEVLRFPSEITVLKSSDNDCWIGTKENYFFRWDGIGVTNFGIPGMTCTNVNRVYVDHASNIWLIPRVNGTEIRWWRGIMSLQQDIWRLYNIYNYPSIGVFGENPDFFGVTESWHDGGNQDEWRMWFGTSGGGIKCFIPGLDDWSQYCVSKQSESYGTFYHQKSICFEWGKSDAIVQDSSKFMWMSAWSSPSSSNKHKSLICYDSRFEPGPEQSDPREAHYRWFFGRGDPNYSSNYIAMIVDVNGNIIAGSEDGKVIVFNYEGNPLDGKINVIGNFTTGINEYDDSELLGKVVDMVTTDDGITRIVTLNGVYKFDPDKDALIKEEFGNGVKAIEAENASVLWLGISNEGLVRYDLHNDERTVFGMTQGLVSNNITDLALDRKKGLMWIATENGISRFSIGYSLEQNPTSNMLVYPNPFSKKRHSMIHFKNLPWESKVEIYNTNGKLISFVKPARQSSEGAYYSWTPNAKTAPGTYFYSIHGDGFAKAGKFLITP